MKIARSKNVLHPAWEILAICVGITILCGLLAYLFLGILNWDSLGAIFAIAFIFLFLMDFLFLLDRIELHENFFRFRHGFQVGKIQWEDIDAITWEKERGLVFTLKSGEVQYGPTLGNPRSTANVLRARWKSQTKALHDG